jgi:cytochrome c5
MYYTIRALNKIGYATAKKIAQQQGTQRQPHPSYGDLNHPKCDTYGCDNTKQVRDWHWTSGKPVYRPVCQECHDANTAARYATKTGATWVKTVADVCAHKEGFNSLSEWLNSKHPYRKHRKDYCENIDSRLGFKCTTTVMWDGMLDVDHIDEDPSNNEPYNLQTLCKCCHAYKSNVFVKEHGRTPGRKALGITY